MPNEDQSAEDPLDDDSYPWDEILEELEGEIDADE